MALEVSDAEVFDVAACSNTISVVIIVVLYCSVSLEVDRDVVV